MVNGEIRNPKPVSQEDLSMNIENKPSTKNYTNEGDCHGQVPDVAIGILQAQLDSFEQTFMKFLVENQ